MNNDPYSGNKELYKRKKQEYKNQNEKALDSIVSEVLNAQTNGIAPKINQADKSAVVRYFNRYWSTRFLLNAVALLVVTFIVSFFTQFATIGIFVVFILSLIYSHKTFLRIFLNDHGIKKYQIKEFEQNIFSLTLNNTYVFIMTLLFMGASVGSYYYTKALFIKIEWLEPVIRFTSNFVTFYPQNELFAYVNTGSILMFMLLKTIERWKL